MKTPPPTEPTLLNMSLAVQEISSHIVSITDHLKSIDEKMDKILKAIEKKPSQQ